MASLPGAEEFLKLFDEFVREYEFGLALEIVCDRLLEPAVAAPSAEVVSRIERLHDLMEVTDNCVASLRDKMQSITRP